MQILVWSGLGFLSGALPFSVWLGRLYSHKDIRTYGDGNPGATNAWKAGGWPLGVSALLLDYAKGFIPVALANFWFGLSGWQLLPVALAPIAGHAYSPFLKFKGGKALAVSFGVWTGLTLYAGPLILGLSLAFFLLLQQNDGWAVLLGLTVFGLYLWLKNASPLLLTIWLFNILLLGWKYRTDLRHKPQPRPFILKALRR